MRGSRAWVRTLLTTKFSTNKFFAHHLFVKMPHSFPDEIRSTKIIGERQFQKAAELFTTATEKLTGEIDFRHVYLNFTDIQVEIDGNNVVKTCPAALGPGFAAGTTDGPGVFGFQQGDTEVSTICLMG